MSRESFLSLIRKVPWLKKTLLALAVLSLFAIFLPTLFADAYTSLIFAAVFCAVFCVVVGPCILMWLGYLLIYDAAVSGTPKIARKGMDVGIKTVDAGYGACRKGIKHIKVFK